MFYGAHDDDLCDLLLSHLFDGEKTYAPRGGWISCQAMVKNLYPQRWLDQLPGDSEKPIPPTRRHP